VCGGWGGGDVHVCPVHCMRVYSTCHNVVMLCNIMFTLTCMCAASDFSQAVASAHREFSEKLEGLVASCKVKLHEIRAQR
jgi:hypothetical protein